MIGFVRVCDNFAVHSDVTGNDIDCSPDPNLIKTKDAKRFVREVFNSLSKIILRFFWFALLRLRAAKKSRVTFSTNQK